MVLYSIASLTSLGEITHGQMETIILEGLVGTNEAFINSEVSARFNPVHIGLVSKMSTPFGTASTYISHLFGGQPPRGKNVGQKLFNPFNKALR